MTHIEKLDTVLKYIAESEYKTVGDLTLYIDFKDKISENEIRLITDKLASDGFIKKDFQEELSFMKPYPAFLCSMTYEGSLFFENKSYKAQKRTYVIRQIGTIAKAIAVTANAIIIIFIAYWGVTVQSDSNKKDETIINIEEKIENLSAKIDSLTTIQTTNKTSYNQAP